MSHSMHPKSVSPYTELMVHNLCLLRVPMVGRNQPKKEWMLWK